MKKMEEKLTHTLTASAHDVWALISKVGGVEKWFSSMITSCSVDGDKRYCTTADGATLEEDVLEINHQTKTFRFGIPKQELLPVENIIETMKVRETIDGTAIVEWSATFEATEENGAIAKDAFKNLWKMGLEEMDSFINTKTETL